MVNVNNKIGIENKSLKIGSSLKISSDCKHENYNSIKSNRSYNSLSLNKQDDDIKLRSNLKLSDEDINNKLRNLELLSEYFLNDRSNCNIKNNIKSKIYEELNIIKSSGIYNEQLQYFENNKKPSKDFILDDTN